MGFATIPGTANLPSAFFRVGYTADGECHFPTASISTLLFFLLAVLGTIIFVAVIFRFIKSRVRHLNPVSHQNRRRRRDVERYRARNARKRATKRSLERISEAVKNEENECSSCHKKSAKHPVYIDCGHVFCCDCIIQHWKETSGVDTEGSCKLCSQIFSKIEPIRWKENKTIHEYNVRFNPTRTYMDYVDDIPALLLHLICTIFRRPAGRNIFVHLGKIICCLTDVLIISYWFCTRNDWIHRRAMRIHPL